MKIGVYCNGNTWGGVNPEALEHGLGGRESAAVYLAEEWGDMGHDVTVFATQKDSISTHIKKKNGGHVSYVDTDLAVPMISAFKYDAFLSWETPDIFSVPGIDVRVKLCGMQVAHIWDTDPELVELPDAWIALSNWHKQFLELQTDYMRRCLIQPNGVKIDRYAERVGRNVQLRQDESPFQFLYSSSPDRGLAHLLRTWPLIRERFPECQLYIAYGLDKYIEMAKWSHGLQGEMAVDIELLSKQDGIHNLGKIGQQQLADLHGYCDALLYPCDPFAPTETGCITVIEACAAGNIPIITNADCLKSEFRSVSAQIELPYNPRAYVDLIAKYLEDKKLRTRLQINGRKFAEKRSWKVIANQWIKMIDGIALEQKVGKREIIHV